MDLIASTDLRVLMDKQVGLCVSIYMPTHRAGAETQQDPIRLKNLLREAGERLSAFELRSPEIQGLLESAQRLLEDSGFWRHQSDGLALFLSPQIFRSFRLPLNFEELVVVTHRFHIKPLLTFFANNGRFFILALSQNQVRLFEGTRHSVDEVDLDSVPKSLAEALQYDTGEQHIQFRTAGPGGTGRQAAIFHGHGALADKAKDRILRYFHQVDDGLRQMLRDERVPLVLAGVDYLFPIYKQVNTYPYLIDEGVPGNPEALKAEDLHTQAWAVVQPFFLKAQQEAAARYRQLAGTERASSDIRELIPATYAGRVDVLFAAVGVQQWGTFDPHSQVLKIHQSSEPGDEDLLDLAAVRTILNDGTVYAVEPAEMPDAALLAAVFRY